MARPDETEVIATFASRHEAEFALETLRAAGIEAALVADDAGGAFPGLAFFRRVRLLVRSEDAEEARATIGDQQDSESSG